MSDRRSSPSSDVEPVVRAALEMMVTGRVDPLVSFTDDVEMQGPMGGASGRKQLKTQLSDWQDGLSDIEITVDRMAVDGSAVAVEWHFDARHSGVAFLMEDMLFEPTGNHVALHLTSEITFRGDRICLLRNSYDLEELVRQLRPAPDD